MLPLSVAVLTVLILIDFLPPIQERCHVLKYVGIHIRVNEFNVDDDISMSVP